MHATELIIAPDADDFVRKAAQALPAYDLMRAYRDARVAFETTDIVLAVVDGDTEGFIALPRSEYVNQAFRRWNERQRQMHPLAKESAHKKLKVPSDTPAFWLVIEYPDKGAIACCAISAYAHEVELGGDELLEN